MANAALCRTSVPTARRRPIPLLGSNRNMSKFVRISTSAVAAVIMAGACATAFAKDRTVNVINKTSFPMIAFHASNTGTDDWEENILGKDVLPAGQNVELDIDDGSGACRFDFKGVFKGGAEAVLSKVNVCEVSDVTFSQN